MLLLVQALLLISQILQGTKRSVQTWSIHGLAVKSALQLGLQSEESLQRFDPLEQEIRRRTWHGCVLLDRYTIVSPLDRNITFATGNYSD